MSFLRFHAETQTELSKPIHLFHGHMMPRIAADTQNGVDRLGPLLLSYSSRHEHFGCNGCAVTVKFNFVEAVDKYAATRARVSKKQKSKKGISPHSNIAGTAFTINIPPIQ